MCPGKGFLHGNLQGKGVLPNDRVGFSRSTNHARVDFALLRSKPCGRPPYRYKDQEGLKAVPFVCDDVMYTG